jgi:uridine phosphorylase
MVFPQFKGKHLEEALFHPEDFLAHIGLEGRKFPSKYVITYQSRALNHFKREYAGKYTRFNVHSILPIHLIKGADIGVVKMTGIGAPHAVTIFEELIGLGAKVFINIGTAGGLQHEGVFLCEKAVRDEGTSHHYIAHGKYAYPDKNLTEKLAGEIVGQGLKFERATSWTIDAPYRETKAEIAHYKKQGVATVEMEASALFSVAKYRGAKIASAFVVSDILGEKWKPKFHHIDVVKTENKLIDAAIACLRKER